MHQRKMEFPLHCLILPRPNLKGRQSQARDFKQAHLGGSPMRILVYIAFIFSFFIFLHKKKKERERSCMQVLDRFIFEQDSCVGARSHSDTSKSLQLGARLWERHLEVARGFVVGSRKKSSRSEVSERGRRVAPAGSDVMGATPRSRSCFRRNGRSKTDAERHPRATPSSRSSSERAFQSDTPRSLAISSTHDARKRRGSDLSQRHPHVAPDPVQVSFLTLTPV